MSGVDPDVLRTVLFAQMVIDAVWWPIMIGVPIIGVGLVAGMVIHLLNMRGLMRPGHGAPPPPPRPDPPCR